MKYAFYSTPVQGWFKVLIEEIRQLGIIHEISGYSYVSPDRQYAYLEQDSDAQIFLNAILAADWFQDMQAVRACTKNIHCESPCFICNLDAFNASELAAKPVPVTIHIHDF